MEDFLKLIRCQYRKSDMWYFNDKGELVVLCGLQEIRFQLVCPATNEQMPDMLFSTDPTQLCASLSLAVLLVD